MKTLGVRWEYTLDGTPEYTHIHTLQYFSIVNTPTSMFSEGGGQAMQYMHNLDDWQIQITIQNSVSKSVNGQNTNLDQMQ